MDRRRAMNKANGNRDRKQRSESVAQALQAAARQARKTARMYGTPIYVWQDGKVVAKKP